MVLATPGRFQQPEALGCPGRSCCRRRRPLKNRARVHFHQARARNDGRSGAARRLRASARRLRVRAVAAAIAGAGFARRPVHDSAIFAGDYDRRGCGAGSSGSSPSPQETNGRACLSRSRERRRPERSRRRSRQTELRGLTLPQLIARTGWLEAEAREAIANSRKRARSVVEQEPLNVAAAACGRAERAACARGAGGISSGQPLVPGMPKEDLRGRCRLRSGNLSRRARADLVTPRSRQSPAIWCKRRARNRASPRGSARQGVDRSRNSRRRAWPCRASKKCWQAAGGSHSARRRFLQILLREKTLVKVREDLILHRGRSRSLRELVAEAQEGNGGRLPIVAFKDTDRRDPEIRYPPAGVPGPGAGDAPGGRRACYTVAELAAVSPALAGCLQFGLEKQVQHG